MEARRGILFLFFLALGTFAFSAGFSHAAGPTDVFLMTITEPTTWTKENSPYILRYKLTVKAKLTIEPGTIVKFSQGTGIEMLAEISAVGTKNEKIVFTSIHDDSVGGNLDVGSERASQRGDWDKINAHPDRAAKFENVVVSYATTGIISQSTGLQYKNLEIKNSEIKNNVTGIDILNLSPVIESNVISNNSTGISTKLNASYPERTTTIRYNSFSGNSTGIFTSNTSALKPPTVDAKYNWWGSDTGPYNNLKNKSGKGDSVSDYWIAFDPWLKIDPNVGLDPVIIIPGIMGSWEVDGKWTIDPLLHSYENLKKAMENAGYVEGESMFDFPYQWRNSNVDNAKLLRDAIDVVKEKTKRPKIDVVAHSMGGLLAREYIESDYYQEDVDQLITLGTPHAGAPEAYPKWEAGDGFSGVGGYFLKKIFEREAKKSGYDGIFHYVQSRPMYSLRELLPIYDYIFDLDSNKIRTYSQNYPKNEFLEKLNQADKKEKLKNVELDIIYGNLDKKNTTGIFEVIDAPAFGDYWKHGYPENYHNLFSGEESVIYVEGDETVPVESAKYIVGDYNIEINAKHLEIPTEAQQDVIELLTGKRPTSKITSEGPKIKEILLVQVYCPVDLQVISPSGDAIGTNFNDGKEINDISGATYVNNGENEEFIVITNPEDGEYQILTEGTDTGDYEVEIAKITQDEETGETEESSQTITGEAMPDVWEEARVKIQGDSVKKVEKMTIPKPEPEKKNVIADQMRTEIRTEMRTEISVSSSNNISAQDNRSRIQKLDAQKSDIRQYFKTKQIKNRKTAAKITKNLSHIRVYLKRYETGTKLKKIKIAKTKANKDIEKLTRFINKNSPKYIAEETRINLIEDLNDLKID
jgi:pimeloyl-ACP methyl ester carboxylesterase